MPSRLPTFFHEEPVFHVVCELIEGDFTDGEIVWIITNPDFKVSEHVLAQKQRTAEAQAIKIIADAKKLGAKSATALFAANPLTAEDERALDKLSEHHKVRDQIQKPKNTIIEIFCYTCRALTK